MILSTALARLQIPPTRLEVPAGFTRVDSPLQQGMPHFIPLMANQRLLIIAPSGVAATWRDLDATTVVSNGADQLQPDDGVIEPPSIATRMPLRVLFQVGNRTASAVALALGTPLALSDGGAARFELIVLDWLLHAGTLRGAGDFGSRLSLAWRQSDRAVDQFSDPPQNPVFVQRQPPAKRLESNLGTSRLRLSTRLQLKNSLSSLTVTRVIR